MRSRSHLHRRTRSRQGRQGSRSGAGRAGARRCQAADAKKPRKRASKPKTFDFTGIDLSGQNRSPQLLYFLERANEELERASLEKRSFIPDMVRSIEEERL